MTWQPGLITAIDGDEMSVKVPTGADCAACHGKTGCHFGGPASAYKTLRVPRVEGCGVGDRLLVEEPGSALAVTFVVMIVLPLGLVLAGYGLSKCCMRFDYATLLLSILGVAIWVAGLYAANRWMTASPRFQPNVRRSDTARDHEIRGKSGSEGS